MEEERPQYACVVCERVGSEGIHVLSRFICADCEWEMVNTPVEDDLYHYFIERLRILWLDMAWLDTDMPGSGC